MVSEWTEERFGSLVRFISDKSQAKDANIDTYISTENMLGDFGGIRCASALPLTGSVTKFKESDTLFSNIRTYFKKVWQARFDGCCSNDVLALRPADEEILVPDYLHQICRWEKFTELSIRTSKGAKMPRGDKDALAGFKFQLPPIKEQRSIAHILGTLDGKIELNRKQNETLEAMARALFKAWFVDFEPVRAKLEGRWQRGQSLPGLPSHQYNLFPDQLVESELGKIPEGWEMTSLSEFSSLNPESWTKRTRPDEIRYVDLSNTKWGRVESVTSYDADDAPSRAQRVLRPLDTIVGTVRPGNGSYALIGDEGLTGSTGFAVLRPLRRESSEYVYLAATAHENIERLSNLADGGAYPAVRPEIVFATQVPRVGQALINKFSQQVSPMIAGIADNDRTSRSLAQLRDTLLPKLISGELRVPDAEHIVGAAV
jgi:type I restriction enzyme, S subunit